MYGKARTAVGISGRKTVLRDDINNALKEAQKAIAERFEKISRSTSHAAEIEAIEKAMDTLDVLRTEASQPKAS